jgi:hypothetical protein
LRSLAVVIAANVVPLHLPVLLDFSLSSWAMF